MRTHCPNGHEYKPGSFLLRQCRGRTIRRCSTCAEATDKRRYWANPEKYRQKTRAYRALATRGN